MSQDTTGPQVKATLELRSLVTVTVPLPGGVTVEDVNDVSSAVDPVVALPPALAARFAAAAGIDGTDKTIGEIHWMWVE